MQKINKVLKGIWCLLFSTMLIWAFLWNVNAENAGDDSGGYEQERIEDIKKIFDEFVQITFDQLVFENRIYQNQDRANLISLPKNDANLLVEIWLHDFQTSLFERGYFIRTYENLAWNEQEPWKINLDLYNKLSIWYNNVNFENWDDANTVITKAILSRVRDKINAVKAEIDSNFLITWSAWWIDANHVWATIKEKEVIWTFTWFHLIIANGVLNFLAKQDDIQKLEDFKNLMMWYKIDPTPPKAAVMSTFFDFPAIQKTYLSSWFQFALGTNLDTYGQDIFLKRLKWIIESKEHLNNYAQWSTQGGVSIATIKEAIDNLDLWTWAYIQNATWSIKTKLWYIDENINKMFVDYNTLNLIQDSLDEAWYIKWCEPWTWQVIDWEKFAFDWINFSIPCSKVEFRKLIDEKRRKIMWSIRFAYQVYKKEINSFIKNSFSDTYRRNALIDSDWSADCKEWAIDLWYWCAEVDRIKIWWIVYWSNSGPINLDPYECAGDENKEDFVNCVNQWWLKLVNVNWNVKLQWSIYSPELWTIDFWWIDVQIDASMQDAN